MTPEINSQGVSAIVQHWSRMVLACTSQANKPRRGLDPRREGISTSGRRRPALLCAGIILAMLASVRSLDQRREDVATAAGLEPAAASALYRELASGAESGWDFSSRWCTPSAWLCLHIVRKVCYSSQHLHERANARWHCTEARRCVLQVQRWAILGDAARHHDTASGPECFPVRYGA